MPNESNCATYNFDELFNISTEKEFETAALAVFNYQAINNTVYKEYLSLLNIKPYTIDAIDKIPFLPIQFFKSKDVIAENHSTEMTFISSGTNNNTSKHKIANLNIYKKSIDFGFKYFYGDITQYTIFALLPSYLERQGSSLIYMVDQWIKQSNQPENGFFLYNHKDLYDKLIAHEKTGKKAILLGVSFALLDFMANYPIALKHTIVMETGGMKGRKEEMTKIEMYQILKKGFGVNHIHSEYGMTELLSQSYAKQDNLFSCPPWMKVLMRNTDDPFSYAITGRVGGVNVIDLANVYSCSFIATDDLGKYNEDDQFEILGRFDYSDLRGCNLLITSV